MKEQYNNSIAVSLYLHFPFCVQKCRYCDFLSAPAQESERQAYIDMLCREIRMQGLWEMRQEGPSRRIVSVYIGGGTPSLMTPFQMEQVMNAVRESFAVEEEAECSMEVNPGTADLSSLKAYRACGINRLSVGVQSMRDSELRLLGRIHTARDAEKVLGDAKDAGFTNVSVDLMSALPGQVPADWTYSLRRVLAWKPSHLSAYSLQIEEGTPFYTMDLPPLPSEEEDREMYHSTAAILKEYGLERYEISNYAVPGAECLHNLGYWTGREYLGMGAGAASLWRGRRFHAPRRLERYYAGVCAGNPHALREEEEVQSAAGRMEEFMFLGLRLTKGVSGEEFLKRFGKPLEQVYGKVLKKHLMSGLILQENGRIRLSEYGMDIANTVMADYLLD